MPVLTPENSFVTLEEAEAYFAERLHTQAWTSTGEGDRIVSLIQATRIFNLYLTWKGGAAPKPGEIPEALKQATCEMALYLLQEDPLAPDSMAGLSRIKLGELELEARIGASRRVIPAYILAMLSGLADLAVYGCSIPVIRS